MSNLTKYFTDRLKFLTTSAYRGSVARQQIETYVDGVMPNRLKKKANITTTIINVLEDIVNIVLASIVGAVRESNIYSAENPVAVRGIAEIGGHSATRAISARGTIRVRQTVQGLGDLGNMFIIDPSAQFLSTENSLTYLMVGTTPLKFTTSQPYIDIAVVEGRQKTLTYTADGSDLFTIHLDDNDPIENYSIAVTVDGISYIRCDNLMELTSKGYIVKNGFTNQVDITFGGNGYGTRLGVNQVVGVTYSVSSGENGILSIGSTFQILGGVYDLNGDQVDVSGYITATAESGFQIAGNGENIDITKAMAGWSSRSLTFPRPENIKAYLSRYTMLSYIDAWTDVDDDRQTYIMALPRILLSNPLDYYTLADSQLILSQAVRTALVEAITASRRQMVSTEFYFTDPTIKQYAIMVYVEGDVNDNQAFKDSIKSSIASYMMSKTYNSSDLSLSNNLLPYAEFVNIVHDMPDVIRCTIKILSFDNEQAKLNGWYDKVVVDNTGGKKTVTQRITLLSGQDDHIGLTDIGDITTAVHEIPVIRGGWKAVISGVGTSATTMDINGEGIHIYKFNTVLGQGWTEI